MAAATNVFHNSSFIDLKSEYKSFGSQTLPDTMILICVNWDDKALENDNTSGHIVLYGSNTDDRA